MKPDQLHDPLRTMLYSGPYRPEELLCHLGGISTWIEDGEFDDDEAYAVRKMLERIQERNGILIPHWWKGTVEEFRVQFNENYAPFYKTMSLSGEPWTPEERQLAILETVLELWREARDAERNDPRET